MQPSTSSDKSPAGPRRGGRQDRDDEGLDEAPHLLDDEPADIEQAPATEDDEPDEAAESYDETEAADDSQE
jgi:hypothetical protein